MGKNNSRCIMRKKAIKKTRTYINGLDEILNGGLPAERTTLVVGEP